MASIANTPYDYGKYDIKITNASGKQVDISRLVIELNVFESLLDPFISGSSDWTRTDIRRGASLGYVIGGGYGWFPEGWDTRILAEVLVTTVNGPGGKATAVTAGVGWLY